MKVRLARESDLDALIKIGNSIRLESVTYFPPIDKEHTRNILKAVLKNPDVGCCFVVEEESVIGFIGGEISFFSFSPEKVAIIHLWHVVPEKRNALAGGKLLARFEGWAWENGAFAVRVGIHVSKDTDKIGGSLERIGYSCVGKDYIKYGC